MEGVLLSKEALARRAKYLVRIQPNRNRVTWLKFWAVWSKAVQALPAEDQRHAALVVQGIYLNRLVINTYLGGNEITAQSIGRMQPRELSIVARMALAQHHFDRTLPRLALERRVNHELTRRRRRWAA